MNPWLKGYVMELKDGSDKAYMSLPVLFSMVVMYSLL